MNRNHEITKPDEPIQKVKCSLGYSNLIGCSELSFAAQTESMVISVFGNPANSDIISLFVKDSIKGEEMQIHDCFAKHVNGLSADGLINMCSKYNGVAVSVHLGKTAWALIIAIDSTGSVDDSNVVYFDVGDGRIHIENLQTFTWGLYDTIIVVNTG